MPSAAEILPHLFRGLRPKSPGMGVPAPPPIKPDEIRGLLREMCGAPKELAGALARLEGETIEKVTEFNQLELLAHQFAAHGEAGPKLVFAKCAGLNGAPKPNGADQPGSGAAAATVLSSDAALLQALKVGKGEFPQICVDGIFWNCVWTTRGKYIEPPPVHDYTPLAIWCGAVAATGNASLKAACLRAGAAALGRHDPKAHKVEAKPTPADPFGMKAVQAEQERIRTAKRVPVEGFLAIFESDPAGPLDELRAANKGELPRMFQAALELDDDIALDALGRALGAACAVVPEGMAGAERAAFLRERTSTEAAERLAFVAAALDRAFAQTKCSAAKKASMYAKVALGSLRKKGTRLQAAMGMQRDAGADPVVAALEKRWLEKAEATGEAAPAGTGSQSGSGSKSGTFPRVATGKTGKIQTTTGFAVGTPTPPPMAAGDRAARSACADLVRPREVRGEQGMVVLGERALAELIGGQQVDQYRAAFARAFDAASAVAVVATPTA